MYLFSCLFSMSLNFREVYGLVKIGFFDCLIGSFACSVRLT